MTGCSFTCLFALLLVTALAIPAPAKAGADTPKTDKLWVYFGTYTRGTKSQGIYRSELDLKTGKLSEPELAAGAVNPSFLAIHPNHHSLYAVTETADFQSKPTGAVTAFALDPKTGALKRLNTESSKGAGPCHIVVDKAGKHVLVANYGSGSAAVLPIQEGGRLGEWTGFVQHQGKSVNPQRQEGPHAHSINLDAANRHAFVADLGLDRIMIYQYDPEKGTLEKNQPSWVTIEAGSGPRHFAFHPSGKYAYLINEMANTVTAMSHDPSSGELEPMQTISTLPQGFQGKSYTAEVVVHPSGKFLYGSNRGQDSLAIFRIDPQTGKLTAAGHQSHKIKTPRNFAIDPSGQYLLAASQDGNAVVVFRVDPQSGALTPTGSVVEVPAPVCVRMVPKTE